MIIKEAKMVLDKPDSNLHDCEQCTLDMWCTDVSVQDNAQPKLYCGIHHIGFYTRCSLCIQEQILVKLERIINIFKPLEDLEEPELIPGNFPEPPPETSL